MLINFIGYIAGFITGGFLGVLVAAMCAAADKDYNNIDNL